MVLTMLNIITTTLTINAEAKAFVIPNQADAWKDFTLGTNRARMKRACGLNEVPFDENEKWVQMWFVCDDLESENLGCHGGVATDPEAEDILNIRQGMLEFIPESVLKNVKEGDTFTWKAYVNTFRKEEDCEENMDPEEAILNLSITAEQLNYRYRQFGSFEEVVAHVTK